MLGWSRELWKENSFGKDGFFLVSNAWVQLLFCLVHFDMVLLPLNATGNFDSITLFVAVVLVFTYLFSVNVILVLIKFIQLRILRKKNFLARYRFSVLRTFNLLTSLLLCVICAIIWLILLGDIWMYRTYRVHFVFRNLFGLLFSPATFLAIFELTRAHICYLVGIFMALLAAQVLGWFLSSKLFEQLDLSDRALMRTIAFIHGTCIILLFTLVWFTTINFTVLLAA